MKGKLITLCIIGVIILLGYLAIKHDQESNTWVDFDGIIVDKYTAGGLGGSLYCLIQVGEERYRESYNCDEFVIGDKVKVELKINNLTGKKTIVWLYER